MDLVVVTVGLCVWSKTDQATEFLCVVSSAIWTCFISQNTSYIMYSNSLLCSLQIWHGPIKSRQLHFTNAQTLDDDEVQLKKSVKISYIHFDLRLSKTILCIPS